jgi:hypothetical protein
MEQRILARLDVLRKEREKYIETANKVVFGYDSVIEELERLLKPGEVPQGDPVENESV